MARSDFSYPHTQQLPPSAITSIAFTRCRHSFTYSYDTMPSIADVATDVVGVRVWRGWGWAHEELHLAMTHARL